MLQILINLYVFAASAGILYKTIKHQDPSFEELENKHKVAALTLIIFLILASSSELIKLLI